MISSAITTTSSSSVIFPTVPILSATSIVFCLLILPGFWKTRIFAVVYHICWVLAGNVLLLVNTCIWKGSVRKIPIYCDIVAIFWSGYSRTLYMCILCVNKFIWTISKPAPSVRVYDGRKRTNVIDAFICVVLPLLLYPFAYLLFTARYTVIEDLGPWPRIQVSIDSFLVDAVPIVLSLLISIGFNCAACYNFWYLNHKRSYLDFNTEPRHQHRLLSTSQRWKYTLMCLTTFCFTTYGAIWALSTYIHFALEPQDSYRWYTTFGLTSNLSAQKEVIIFTREIFELEDRENRRTLIGFVLSLPLLGIHAFLFFGLGSEARKTYTGWCQVVLGSSSSTRLLGCLKWLVDFTKTQLGHLGGITWRRGRHRLEPSSFTPFENEDIILDDLSTPWHSIGARPSPPPIAAPAPSSSKQSRIPVGPISLWREYRKEPLPPEGGQEEGDRDAQRRPGPSSKAILLQTRPAYVVYRKSSE